MTDESSPIDGDAPTRVIKGGIFPTSPRANRREGIFSDTLAGILGSDPEYNLKHLRSAFHEADHEGLSPEEVEELEAVLDAKYVTEPRDNQESDSDALIPFHPIVAKHIEPPQSHEWDAWYRLLMTRPATGNLNKDTHAALVSELEAIDSSNIFEELFRELIEGMAPEADSAEAEIEPPEPGRCYIPDLAEAFQEDILSWTKVDSLSGSQRLLSLRDLLCFYYMMYLMQVARNLDSEWSQFLQKTPQSWAPEVDPIPFGIRTETASSDREFRTIWKDRTGDPPLFDQLYYSWMRLTVLRILNDTIDETGASVSQKPATLLEARKVLEEDDEYIEKVVENLLDPVNDAYYTNPLATGGTTDEASTKPDAESVTEDSKDTEDTAVDASAIRDAAEILFYAIDDYYRGRSAQQTSAVRLGPAAVKQLGISEERGFIESRQRTSTILVLNEGAMTLMARLFTQREKRGNENFSISNFRQFLADRGIKLTDKSQQAAEKMLERIGLIQKESDSGDSTNVRTY